MEKGWVEITSDAGTIGYGALTPDGRFVFRASEESGQPRPDVPVVIGIYESYAAWCDGEECLGGEFADTPEDGFDLFDVIENPELS